MRKTIPYFTAMFLLASIFMAMSAVNGVAAAKPDNDCWCCVDGKVSKVSPRQCNKKRGECFKSKKAAKKECRESLCWCCLKGKIEKTSADACKKRGGQCFKSKRAAKKECQEKVCWCCLKGKVGKASAENCKKRGGECYKSQRAAKKECQEKLCWCCVDGRLSKVSPRDCKKRQGRCYKRKKQAKRKCSEEEKIRALLKKMDKMPDMETFQRAIKNSGLSKEGVKTLNRRLEQPRYKKTMNKLIHMKKPSGLTTFGQVDRRALPGPHYDREIDESRTEEQCYVGGEFVLQGRDFGPDQLAVFLKVRRGQVECPVRSWDNRRIVVRIPPDTADLMGERSERIGRIGIGRPPWNNPVYREKSTCRVTVRNPTLRRPDFRVDQDNLRVTVSVRGKNFVNKAVRAIYHVRNDSGQVTYGMVENDNATITDDEKVEIGSFSLADHRDNLFGHDDCEITVSIDGGTDDTRVSITDTQRWRTKTYTLDNSALELLGSLSSYDIRLNNYGGGVHPHVRNDCHLNLTLIGHSENRSFNLDPVVPSQELLVAVAPFPFPVRMPVAIYVNNISASGGGADLFSIRDGKLVIRAEFPNPGERELKIGVHNWGRNDEFRDNPIADVNLSAFSVEIILTPVLSSGNISFEDVRIQVDGVSGELNGNLERLLNSSGIVRRYLNDTLEDVITSQLSSYMNSGEVRSALRDGIHDRLIAALDCNRIVSVTARGNTIVVRYL